MTVRNLMDEINEHIAAALDARVPESEDFVWSTTMVATYACPLDALEDDEEVPDDDEGHDHVLAYNLGFLGALWCPETNSRLTVDSMVEMPADPAEIRKFIDDVWDRLAVQRMDQAEQFSTGG